MLPEVDELSLPDDESLFASEPKPLLDVESAEDEPSLLELPLDPELLLLVEEEFAVDPEFPPAVVPEELTSVPLPKPSVPDSPELVLVPVPVPVLVDVPFAPDSPVDEPVDVELPPVVVVVPWLAVVVSGGRLAVWMVSLVPDDCWLPPDPEDPRPLPPLLPPLDGDHPWPLL